MSDLHSFHGARCVDLAHDPIRRFDAEHPEGFLVFPPRDRLSVNTCERCGHEFFVLPVLSAPHHGLPTLCRPCAMTVQNERDAATCERWTDAIAADGLGLPTSIVGTGGGCTAIAVDLGGERCEHSYTGSRFYALVTDDAMVPDGDAATIGIYDALEDDGCGEAHAYIDAESPDEGAQFLFLWADRLVGIDAAGADTLQRWGIDPGRRTGFGAA